MTAARAHHTLKQGSNYFKSDRGLVFGRTRGAPTTLEQGAGRNGNRQRMRHGGVSFGHSCRHLPHPPPQQNSYSSSDVVGSDCIAPSWKTSILHNMFRACMKSSRPLFRRNNFKLKPAGPKQFIKDSKIPEHMQITSHECAR